MTGRGVTIGFLDQRFDLTHPEFAGRVHPLSLGNEGTVTHHGTLTSGVALAARDGYGMHGVAYEATLLALAVQPACSPNCGPANQGPFYQFGQGVNFAHDNGARVINMSLGSTLPPDAELTAAISRVTAAGTIIVMSAGNDGLSTPTAFMEGSMRAANGGPFIVAGAVDANGAMSPVSNRAGNTASSYLAALGLGVNTVGSGTGVTSSGGTSLSAPIISGAAALLIQAFPHLTGRQVVDILFRSADDAGAPGVDPIYGNGILNIARAFQPVGQASIAGTSVPLTALAGGWASVAMGDATAGSIGPLVILDEYARAFTAEAGSAAALAGADRPMTSSLAYPAATWSTEVGPFTFSAALLPVAERSNDREAADWPDPHSLRQRFVGGTALARLSSRRSVGLGLSIASHALRQQLGGRSAEPFMVAVNPMNRVGFQSGRADTIGLRHRLLGANWTATSESGTIWDPSNQSRGTASTYRLDGLSVERKIDSATLALDGSVLRERDTILGGRFARALSTSGSTTRFVGLGLTLPLAPGWAMNGAYRHGWTSLGSGQLASGGELGSNAWHVDLARFGALLDGDRLVFRVAQPLRVVSGGMNLGLPTGYDQATGQAVVTERFLSLSPSGREVDLEAAYGLPLLRGRANISFFYRTDPGHVAAMPDDRGAAVRFRSRF